MRIRTVCLIAVAVACGTAGSRMTKRLLSSPSGSESGPERVTVLAAKQPMPVGTVLRDPERWFEERAVVKGEEPEKAIRQLYQLRGRQLVRALDTQVIVTAEHLADEEPEGAGLLKKEGRKPIDLVVASPGEILFPPDARVDVLTGRRTDVSGTAASPVARHLPLLGVRPVDKQSVIATLAVTAEELQLLRQAAADGGLRLRISLKR